MPCYSQNQLEIQEWHCKISSIMLWCHSIITLSKNYTSFYKLKTFVANRVKRIQDLMVDVDWDHVDYCKSNSLLIFISVFNVQLAWARCLVGDFSARLESFIREEDCKFLSTRWLSVGIGSWASRLNLGKRIWYWYNSLATESIIPDKNSKRIWRNVSLS